MMTAIGSVSRANIECARGVVVPSLAGKGGLMCVAELASRENGMGVEVEGEVV